MIFLSKKFILIKKYPFAWTIKTETFGLWGNLVWIFLLLFCVTVCFFCTFYDLKSKSVVLVDLPFYIFLFSHCVSHKKEQHGTFFYHFVFCSFVFIFFEDSAVCLQSTSTTFWYNSHVPQIKCESHSYIVFVHLFWLVASIFCAEMDYYVLHSFIQSFFQLVLFWHIMK